MGILHGGFSRIWCAIKVYGPTAGLQTPMSPSWPAIDRHKNRAVRG